MRRCSVLIAVVLCALIQSAWAQVLQQGDGQEPLKYHDRVGIIPGPAGVVEKIQNKPKVTRVGDDDKESGKRLSLASEVFQQDKVFTDSTSRVQFRLRDRTYVELAPLSSFGVERVRRGPERDADRKDETILTFYYGLARVTAVSVESWVRFYVKHNERVITVEGPADFYVESDAKTRDLRVFVRKGKVSIASALRGLEAEIPEGTICEVRKDNTLKPSQQMSSRKWAALKSQTVIRVNKL